MERAYDYGALPDLTPKMARLLDRQLRRGTIRPKGGHFVGPNDIRQNVYYTPYVKGYPLYMRSVSRMVGAYMAHREMALFGGGGKRAVGAGVDDKTLLNAFRAFGLQTGMYDPRVIGSSADLGMVAATLSAAAWARKHIFLPNSHEIPRRADDIAVLVDPSKGSRRDDLQPVWDKLAIMEGEGKIRKEDLHNVDLRSVEAALQHLFGHEGHETLPSGELAVGMAQKILSGEIEPIKNVRWISRQFVDGTGLLSVPLGDKYKASMLGKVLKYGGMTVDALNDFVKGVVTILSPTYMFVNLAGNLVMNMIQQGAFMPSNLLRAVRAHGNMEGAHRRFIDKGMGGGFIRTMTLRSRPGQIINHTLGSFVNAVVDLIPRRAAFIHEARSAGYKDEGLTNLIQKAIDGDDAAIGTLDHIFRKAKDAIVDYDRMSPMERDVLSRIIFFYPWVKGSSRWTMRFIVEHPVQAAFLALMAEHAQDSKDDVFGEGPEYARWKVPISTSSVGLGPVGLEDVIGEHTWTDKGTGLPMSLDFRQLLPPTTLADILTSGISFLTWGHVGASPAAAGALVNNITPVPSAAITALQGYDPFKHEEVQPGLQTFLDQLLGEQSIPLVQRVQSLTQGPEERAKHNAKALNPRSFGQDVWRFGMGGIAPAPYSPKAGKLSAAYESGSTYKVAEQKLKNDWEAAGLGEVSSETLEQLRWKDRIDNSIKANSTYKERALVAAKLYAEKYGNDSLATAIPNLPDNEVAFARLYERIRAALYPSLNAQMNTAKKLAAARASVGGQ